MGIGFTYSPYNTTTISATGSSMGKGVKQSLAAGLYFGKQWSGFNYKLGMWIGSLKYFSNGQEIYDVENMSVAPILSMSIGNPDKFYVSGHIGDDFNFGLYRYFLKAGVGGAFTLGDDYLRYHLGVNERSQFLLDTSFPVGQGFYLAPSIALSEDPILGIGFRYQVQ